MRPAAQIDPIPLSIEFDLLALGDGVDQFDLESLALFAEELLCGITFHDRLRERLVAPDDLAHLLLDGRKVLGRKRLVAVEIVEEAVLDHRTDGDLRAGKKLLHGLGQNMRAVMADEIERFRVVAGDELD